MASNFWNNPSIEPKRNFRFTARIAQFPNIDWLVKTVDKPKFEVSSIEHKYLNHTFNYPGRVTWQPVSMTIIDPGAPTDAGGTLMTFLRVAGYAPPQGNAETAFAAAATNMTKLRSVVALGDVTITQLGVAEGLADIVPGTPPSERIIDQWRLVNPFIDGSVEFGTLDYTDEEMTTITMTLKYDFAYLTHQGGQQGLMSAFQAAGASAASTLGLSEKDILR